MPCTNCSAPYSATRREQGCSNCALGFCGECLKNKVLLPHLASMPVSVCPSCFQKIKQSEAVIQYGPVRERNVKPYDRWWPEGELPPPSMRHNYSVYPNPLRRGPTKENASTRLTNGRHFTSSAPGSSRIDPEDKKLRDRLNKLKDRPGEITSVPTINEIEERLARLRGVSVEEIRNPGLMFARNKNEFREETVESLMEKARDEAMIEKKWERRDAGLPDDDVDEIPVIKPRRSHAASTNHPSNDILMGDETIRGLKDIERSLKLAEKECQNAAKFSEDEDATQKEMNEIVRLTRQKSLKNERINAEMNKFWDDRLDKYGDLDDADSDFGIDEEELQKIIREAEKAECEAKETVKESKKVRKKGGFFSRLFRSSES